MKKQIDRAILLHNKENISASDILNGDQLIFDILFKRKRMDEEKYIELRNYIEKELEEKLPTNLEEVQSKLVVDNEVDEAISKFLDTEFNSEIANVIKKIALAPKKMLRAKLFLAQQSVENNHLAALIELFHLVTLIQDDVIDKAHYRRHQETLNYKYTNRIAIIISDLLLSKIVNSIYEEISKSVSKEDVKENQKIMKFFERKFTDLIDGLIASELTVAKINTLSDYEDYAIKKTANLFSFAMLTGIITNQNDDFDLNYLYQVEKIAIQFGLIFQKIDDLIDYQNNFQLSGKKSRDQENGVKNYMYFKLKTNTLTEIKNELNYEVEQVSKYSELQDFKNELIALQRRINE